LFKIFEFNTFARRLEGSNEYVPVEKAKELISDIDYDGGTDISCIDDPISELCVSLLFIFK